MNAKKIIDEIEAAIRSAEDEGVEHIELNNLKAYLHELKEYAAEQKEIDAIQTQRDLTFYEAKNATRLEHYKAKVSRISSGFQAVIIIGQGALKSCSLINGGACFALLAFIGNILTKPNAISMVPGLSKALLIFASGVLFAAIAAGTTYLSQNAYETKHRKAATLFQRLSISMVILSYIAFLAGVVTAYLTFNQWI